MKITGFKVYPLSVPLEKPIVTSFGVMKSRQACILELSTDDGISGWGESWINYPQWGLQERTATLNAICERIIGSDVSDPKAFNTWLKSLFSVIARQWGAVGPILQAISAVDLAIWDVVAKSKHVPVYKLLGGTHKQVRVYGSGIAPDDIEKRLNEAIELGYQAVKVKIGFDYESDIRAVKHARDIWGDRHLMLDANQGWTLDEALKIFLDLASYHPCWIEEPLAADDKDGLVRLSAQSSLPIAVGENLYGNEFHQIVDAGSAHYIQPDLTKMGGLSSALEVVKWCADQGITVVPHVFGTALSIVASSHFNAITQSPWLEVDMNDNPFRSNLLVEGLNICGGYQNLSEKPGWGVELDRKMLKRFQAL
ncbi:mandelate racemase/muconate lactonizing enzyme family protein [Ferroacidibacillus organovorans]|uniref:Mandelate racemase/muconate lactonizing enzyme C-terminal domain-containing protein n=1 Tax=Ferroacidibacillus organovorans TaxID=1765683 RepID=A0A853KB02_9BACL|nr:mandelate racemase/muconate lactonizing enzyme family protein [Ferroacidibacillus organovorans]KYP81438.1 hypothetical protein AYJ22_07380 [Ferroacidibacillus organovorans]OAG94023.1 hypothetical protein AYW79_07815 [Ferroacidibacillus organovorans]